MQIPKGVPAIVAPVATTQRQPAAWIDTADGRIEPARLTDEDSAHLSDNGLGGRRLERSHLLGGLLRGDDTSPRGWLLGYCHDRRYQDMSG